MNCLPDQQLLRDYTERRSESAVAELVRRHVDFVYSAARRIVRDAHLAEDVTQEVFVALAQNARQLADRPVLSGWLHRTARNLAVKAVRSDARRRAREQEATMNELLPAEADADWERIGPQLDEALGALNESDRDALLLRYFERKSAREIAGILGISDEAAQKRVSRAVERLREIFAERGISVGAGGLVVVITTNAIQAAPAGLAATISAGAAVAGAATATPTVIAAAKAITMTTLQKTLITATLAVMVGVTAFETRQLSSLRGQNRWLEQERGALAEQIQQLQRERADATSRQGTSMGENTKPNSGQDANEVLRLRGQVGRLQAQVRELTPSIPQAPPLSRGFGALGELLMPDSITNAGNKTAEALLQTAIYALRQGDVPLLSRYGISNTIGDAGTNEPLFQVVRAALGEAASGGFRLSSKGTDDGQGYKVRLDSTLSTNFFMEMVMKKADDGWTLTHEPLDAPPPQDR